ncbi:MAG: peptidase [Ilumatobacteraceae bacterium]|nr:peptidase [Ilumatobacteraceae bacterium]
MISHRRAFAATALFAALSLAACSSDSTSAPTTTATSTTATTVATSASSAPAADTPTSASTVDTTAETEPATTDASTEPSTTAAPSTTTAPAPCVAPDSTTPVSAAPADSTGQEWSITSFDGAVIRAHWFPLAGLTAGATAPTVLMGPGWGSSGDTDATSDGTPGVVNIATLHAAGFNVLTWDPRGFGASTGTVEIDSPDFEGRDVQQLLDWVSTMPGVELDGTRDPRVGMFGASYGGGIQLVTASIDCRIDAIVPVIAWHSLQTSLFKADTPKTGWANFLAGVSAGHQIDPTMKRANDASNSTGVVDPTDVQWFADRGPGDAVSKISVPTLIIQGTVDTLFTLDEGATNYTVIHGDGVPTAMLWFCGGHGACLTNAGDIGRVGDEAVAWLQHYVSRLDATVAVPAFAFVDQDGVTYTADEFPLPAATPLTATGTGTLNLTADGGAGPATIGAAGGLGAAVSGITPGKATNAVDVTIPAPAADTVLVGAPTLNITYIGTVADGDRPTRVFAQLVDDTTGLVLGNQITPIDVTLDGQPHTAQVPLEMIAFTAHPAGTVTLQLVATTVAYAQPRLGGSIDFSAISIDLPAVTGATAVPAS